MDPILSALTESLPKAQTLEELARPLLALLNRVSGMESTYLTTIDTDRGVQKVEFARNAGAMTIPEGLVVPWADTLCRRALEENRLYSDDVAACWGDSEAAKALGIQTYISSPVRSQQGKLLGTLCAASSHRVPRAEHVESVLSLFSALLGYALEREHLVRELKAANDELARLALTDPLTGLANRRGITRELAQQLGLAQRDGRYLLVAVIDLDGFKEINDRFGHLAGDRFLQSIAKALRGVLDSEHQVGRLGGDEFLVIALGKAVCASETAQAPQDEAAALQARLSQATVGRYELADGLPAFDYAGASVGAVALRPDGLDADEAIRCADRAMYQVKAQRRGRGA